MKEDPKAYPSIEVARAEVWKTDGDLKKRYDDERAEAH
jgi:hypothetical protein